MGELKVSKLNQCLGSLAILVFVSPPLLVFLGILEAANQNVAKSSFNLSQSVLDYPREARRVLDQEFGTLEIAINIDSWIDQSIFREDPTFAGSISPRVIRGQRGFLFLGDALDTACKPFEPPEQTVKRAMALAHQIRKLDKDVLIQIVPDKSSIYPEYLPKENPKVRCAQGYVASLYSEIASMRSNLLPDMQALLVREKTENLELYLSRDSHWNSRGALVAIQQAVNSFRPGLWEDTEIRNSGRYTYQGDLDGLLGKDNPATADGFNVDRSSSVQVQRNSVPGFPFQQNGRFRIVGSDEVELVKGRTLLLLDSFGLAALPNIIPFFEDLTVVRLVDFEVKGFQELIWEADRIWIMSVERSSSYRFMFELGTDEFIKMLRQ